MLFRLPTAASILLIGSVGMLSTGLSQTKEITFTEEFYTYKGSQIAGNEPEISAAKAAPQLHDNNALDVDFGDEGEVILRVYLRDILLTDAMFAIFKNGKTHLPLAELSSLIDFPIIVDSVSGTADGWFLNPENKFRLDVKRNVAIVNKNEFAIDNSAIFSDELDIYVSIAEIQKWLPLFFDISYAKQTLIIRSSEVLPKEQARNRLAQNIEKEVSFSARKPFDVPTYRLIDWPELSVSLGSNFRQGTAPGYDYRVNAAGDLAFMSAALGFSGTNDDIRSTSLVLSRKNPRGMLGPLRIVDFEIGDTSQFLPGLIGSSLSGRGARFGNTRLSNKRDLDTIDLQGQQQLDYEVELFVNDRLIGVDRDSTDGEYDFQDVPLFYGQNEIRLEFYGPQGQNFTEKQQTFVGKSNGRKGFFSYEMALVEPNRSVFDLFENDSNNSTQSTENPVALSGSLDLTYGLTRKTTVGLTLANIANETATNDAPMVTNSNYVNASITTDLSGALLSTDVTMDTNRNLATSTSIKTTVNSYDIDFKQSATQAEFRTAQQTNAEQNQSLTKYQGSAGISRKYFSFPLGRFSYGANSIYRLTHGNQRSIGLGGRVDVQGSLMSLSWDHDYSRNLNNSTTRSAGQIGVRLYPTARSAWSLSSNVQYSDSGNRFFNSGSIRAAGPLAGNGGFNLTAQQNLEDNQTSYSASLSKRFRQFRFDSTLSATDQGNVALRLGVGIAARKYPGRWLPTFSNYGGQGAVAAQVFADDNNNNRYDKGEELIEGVRLTRNGLPTNFTTNKNGVALMTGLSFNSSVDLGLIEADINAPDLKFTALDKGILPRAGRIPLVAIPLHRATDLEGTVTIQGDTPAPNVRMKLTPIDGGESIEIYTEFDGYYYFTGVPLGTYSFGPDPEQLRNAGLVSRPKNKRLVLENLTELPDPEDFVLQRIDDVTDDGQLSPLISVEAEL